MHALLGLSRLIDGVVERVGKATAWLVLVAVLISAGNAVSRKAFDLTSNAFLEMQWYLFSAIFLLGCAYTLQKQEHVKIDILYSRFSRRTQIKIDIFGTLFFLLPFACLLLWLSWPYFLAVWHSGERSANAGGLILWPVKLLIPTGFALLVTQGLSELIKRIAYLTGDGPDPMIAHEKPPELEPVEALKSTLEHKVPRAP